jgi:hypothetical protein
MRILWLCFAACLLAVLNQSCVFRQVQRELVAVDSARSLNPERKYLKAHMKNGELYVLHEWSLTESEPLEIMGLGKYYDANRRLMEERMSDAFVLPLDAVALFETNQTGALRGEIAAMSIITGASAVLTVFCLVNPKACFGSCPTYYAFDGDTMRLQAEGFSSSISPSMEAADVDMLYHAQQTGPEFRLGLTNEALETHVIRYSDLLVFPRQPGERVFAGADGRWLAVRGLQGPRTCRAPEGECAPALAAFDTQERFSLADSQNLAAKEVLELDFGPAPEQPALVIAARQSLMTTYLFYSSLAYMGRTMGYWSGRLEAGDEGLYRAFRRMYDLLGGIEIQIPDAKGRWQTIETLREAGPIATDAHVIPLPPHYRGKVRIRMTKGLWRLNYLAAGSIAGAREPVRLAPSRVESADAALAAAALEAFTCREQPLVTMPGAACTLVYTLPGADTQWEFFLESKGYYLEWMRNEWLADESPYRLALLYKRPRALLRKLAPPFKAAEPDMESAFWNSRYVVPN